MDLDKEALRNAAVGFAAVGEIVVYTICGYALGRYCDRAFGLVTPWTTSILAMVGFVGGFYRLYLIFKKLNKNT